MKKLFIVALMVFLGMSVQAQSVKGDMAAGVNAAYGTKDGYSNYGFGAKFQYNLTDAIRIEPSATYFLEKDNISMWDVNVNVQYLFNVVEKLTVYPLAGVTLLGASVDIPEVTYMGQTVGGGSESETKFGFNVGAGAQYWLTETLALNFDVKYQFVSDFDRPVFMLGGVYKF